MCEIWPKDWIDAEDNKNDRSDRRNVFCFPQWHVVSKFPSDPTAFPYDIQGRASLTASILFTFYIMPVVLAIFKSLILY